jgi:L-cysteine:1D-myo-inositol 2-amino-2-deoxy-alpha-D-glucopyranoside ligase
MRLYDTLSQQETPLAFAEGMVKMYACGITPYDTSHLGHARVAVVYDTLRRFLEWTGLRVRYVQNITDIDDPLFERAARDGVDWRVLGDQQTERYLHSLAQLNVERPEFLIKATAEIPAMIPVIARLIDLGHAYVRGGAVYYSVDSQPDFGAICHCDRDTMLAIASEMGNNPDDPNKRDPLDFILWQPSNPGEPAWDSPWGPGRPGWHIECSTIATRYLGPQLDIHGGGTDLIFPHHACEIAQAEPATGVHPFVRAWMHVGLVLLGGIKMSKSLGNMVFVQQVLDQHPADALRLALLNQPYRADYEFAWADVAAAAAQLAAMHQALSLPGGHGPALDETPYRGQFQDVLNADFNTPEASLVLSELAGAIQEGAEAGLDVAALQTSLRELAGVLGLTIGGARA